MGCQFNRSTQHMLLLDGVYTGGHAAQAKPRFQRVKAPDRAQCLKRVFRIDVETCQACGRAVKIIASIVDPVVIRKILAHLEQAAPVREVVRLPGPRAPPERWG